MKNAMFNLIKVDPEYLSPCYGRDNCLVINVYDYATQHTLSVDDDGFKWVDWDRKTEIGLAAPCEEQPEWDKLNCAQFIAERMEAINQISKMGKPRLMIDFDDSAPISMNWPWDHEVKPIEEEIGYKPSMRRMRSWMKVRKTDKILWDYYLTRGAGIEPKIWHDDYLAYYDGADLDWYSDLPGYDTSQGVYMSDGMYATASSSEEVWESILKGPCNGES